ncbi:hypothetical protein GGQ02_003284 [Salinibacter ruber]|uniref:hypothetical protein n=1 Tax=Salinibacter ruber TaxID=146919 RepID=UPI00216A6A0E|nr:hypothetical protein [Salinibacter ruber]MCS4034874.1 hypothetical protein [Salinibacter ruber]
MPGKTPKYSETYKLAVIILASKGEDPHDLAKCIKPTAGTIRNWISKNTLTGKSRDNENLDRVKRERNSLAEILSSVLGDR